MLSLLSSLESGSFDLATTFEGTLTFELGAASLELVAGNFDGTVIFLTATAGNFDGTPNFEPVVEGFFTLIVSFFSSAF